MAALISRLVYVALVVPTVAPLLLPGPLSAQSVPIPAAGNVEFAALGGFNAGTSLSSESALAPGGTSSQRITSPTSNGSIDLQIAANWSRHFLATAGWGYVAGGRSVYNEVYYFDQPSPTTQNSSVIARASSTRASAGIQYLIPLIRYPHLIPYAGLAGGVLRSSGGLSVSAVGGPPGESSSATDTSYHGSASLSGGVRYYFNERVGIRFETQASRVTARGYLATIGFGLFIRVR